MAKNYWEYPICKFLKFDEYTIDIFENNRLYLNSPVNFNDPYEGQNEKMPFLEHDTLITCFTGLGNESGTCQNTLFNPIMWSHYADYGKGFCLVFDPLIAGLFQVQYTDVRKQEYSYLDTLTHKGTVWSYENELRFISDKSGNELGRVEYENGNYFLKFYPDDLKAVVFGTRTPSKIKSKIFDYISRFVMKNDEGERGIKSMCIKQLTLSPESYDFQCKDTFTFTPITKENARKWTILPYLKGNSSENGSIEDIIEISPLNKPKSRPETLPKMNYK